MEGSIGCSVSRTANSPLQAEIAAAKTRRKKSSVRSVKSFGIVVAVVEERLKEKNGQFRTVVAGELEVSVDLKSVGKAPKSSVAVED